MYGPTTTDARPCFRYIQLKTSKVAFQTVQTEKLDCQTGNLTVAGSCTAAAPGRMSPSPPASVAASAPRPTPSGAPAGGCTRSDRCCWCWTENSNMAAQLAAIHRKNCSRHGHQSTNDFSFVFLKRVYDYNHTKSIRTKKNL